MKKSVYFLLAVALFACNQADDQKTIKEQIKSYKEEVRNINKQIKELEAKLDKDSFSSKKELGILVDVKEIQPETFYHYFNVSGSVEAKQQAFITAEMGGQIRNILVKEGQRVSKGELLVRLNTDILESSIQEVNTGLALAKKVFEKQEQLWRQKIGSEIQYLQAKNNKESLEQKLKTLQAQKELSLIRSPFSGIVDRIFQKEGELASPGRQLIQLVNLDRLIVRADVSENYLPYVHKGDTVVLTFPAYGDIRLHLPISRTGNVINPQNRTFEIVAEVPNKDEFLKPNMVCTIRINDYKADSAMVVPSVVIKQDMHKGDFIYVAKLEGDQLLARKKYIQTGKSYQGNTMVMDNLMAGDMVIVSGYNMVSEAAVLSYKK